MAFTHKQFDVAEIKTAIRTDALEWPKPSEADEEATLGGNRHYQDLRAQPWDEVKIALDLEAEFVRRIETADDPDEEIAQVEEEREQSWEDDYDPLSGLDLGVASATLALAAARCIPFSSCNAEAFGGRHAEAYPLIAFHVRPEMAALLSDIAEGTGVGFDPARGGGLIAYASNIPAMMAFGAALYARRNEIDAIKLPAEEPEVDEE